ncbi:MAG: FtsX-like permease family protein [Roseivirga sp.]|nr:FtsX-like permease family protein [Roseivirga sp.]
MIFSLIKQSLRHHTKNKVSAFINVFGLSLGMACFILLALLVKYELSYDSFQKNKDLIYQVQADFDAENRFEHSGLILAPAGPLFAEMVPEIEDFTRFKSSKNVLAKANGNRFIIPQLHSTDVATLRFFDLEFLKVSAESVELNKSDILISRSAAEKLYGSADSAPGEPFEIPGYSKFVVKAVFNDLPQNTHLAFDYLISFDHVAGLMHFETGSNFNFLSWSAGGYPTYIKTKKAVEDLVLLEGKMEGAMKPHVERKITLIPLEEVYFSDRNEGYFKSKGDDRYLNLYLLIGIIVLIVAVVNYTNLTTARFSKRAKEVGVRKVVGGGRSQLILQFLAESIALVMVSSIAALCLFELVIPFFNSYLGMELTIDYSSISTYVIFIGFTVFVGTIAGIYPSLFLSAFSPKQGLNKGYSGKKSGVFRKVLVGFQFATCLGLMVVTAVVYQQHAHISKLDTGLNKELLVVLPLKDKNLQASYLSFKNELLTNPEVMGVAGASINVFGEEFFIKTDVEGQEDMLITWVRVEENFFDLMEIEKEEGLLFSEQQESDRQRSVIINQAAVGATGWETPLSQSLMESRVTGIVKDFIYGSARNVISPMMIHEGKEGDFECAYIRINGNISDAMTAIQDVFDEFSPDHPFEYRFLDDEFTAKYESEKKLGEAFAAFSMLTLFIAGLGVLGLSIFIAETRTKEIGIRKVLGAGINRIVWLLNGDITLLILGVAVIILPLAYYVMTVWLQGFAFRIDLNLLYFFTPLLSLLIVVWGILLYQSLRSARLNPVEALRSE